MIAARRWMPALLLLGVLLLAACGGGGATPIPTAAPAATGPRPTTTPPPTIDPIHVRTGSAIIPSPTGQSASGPSSYEGTVPSVPSPGALPPTVPIPTATTGMILPALPSGQTFTTADKKATIRYPNDWRAQSAQSAAQFQPNGASPNDPNMPIVTFNGVPAQLDLLKGDNAESYAQTLAGQTIGRGATNLQVRSVDRVRLGSPSGPEAVRFVFSYTALIPVVSVQVIVQPPGSDQTYFISATAPAGDYTGKWAATIDGIAGSVTFA